MSSRLECEHATSSFSQVIESKDSSSKENSKNQASNSLERRIQ
jgi:hypothetical protein